MSEQLIKTPSVFGDNGNFLLERELGSGGMGGVYMGRDKMLDRPVAVKVMLKEFGTDAEFLERFKKEAQAAARLIHPNIVQVYSYGVSDGMPYMALELAAGGSLYSLMMTNPGKTDIQRVLKVCQQTAQALQCASDQGVIHGDVKPENILFDANGNAKLVDFGLAGMQKDTKEIWGTPYYISPEKVRKEPIDFRADMYSLGGTLYHALTGIAPFEGADAVAVVKKRFEGAPKKPSEIRSEITPAVDKLVMTMLELDKEKRYPSFEALLEAFKEVLSTGLTQSTQRPTALTSSSGPSRGVKRTMVMRNRRTVSKPIEKTTPDVPDEEEERENLGGKVALVIFGVIALIGGIVGGLFWYQSSAAKARERETQEEIVSKGRTAHDAILTNRKRTEEFYTEFAALAQKATEECETLTTEIAKLLPEYASMFKPAPTKELLDAQAAAANGDTPATNTTSSAEAPKVAESTEPAKEMPKEVQDVRELWERVYGCQAGQIRISILARNIYSECDKAAQLPANTREDVEALGRASVDIKDQYEQMVASKDVDSVKKGVGFVKSKAKKILEQTVRRLRIEKAEAERAALKAAQEAAEKAAREKAEQEKKELIEKETSEITSKFDAIAAQGCFRQLDWESAIRQLKSTSSYFKTEEGKLAAAVQLKKVERMKAVQDLFIAKLQNYTFKAKIKHPLRNAKVLRLDEKEIVFQKVDNKTARVSWQKFYRDCPGHLNEVIDHFIVNGRTNSDLNLRSWADTMMGAAMTMRLVCAEVRGAPQKVERLAKAVYAKYEDYQKMIKETFPDISFDDVKDE